MAGKVNKQTVARFIRSSRMNDNERVRLGRALDALPEKDSASLQKLLTEAATADKANGGTGYQTKLGGRVATK